MEHLAWYLLRPYLYMLLGFGLFLLIFKFGLKLLTGVSRPQRNKVDKSFFYRDIPCFERIDVAYWLLYNFSDMKKDDLNNGLLGAYLLSWYKKGYINIQSSQKAGWKRENYSIDLKEGNWDQSLVDQRIYGFLKSAAGNNNILEKNEIRNYCNVDGNKLQLNYLFKSILQEVQKELENQKYITVIPAKNYIFFKSEPQITLSEELQGEYQNLVGLKNFLADYSCMEEKQHVEVHLWEDYLIFANLLGIADKVKQQFHKIYPNFNAAHAIFDVSFDNTIEGLLNSMYKSNLLYFGAFIASLLLIAIVLLGNADLTKIVSIILLVGIFGGMLGWLLSKYLLNKKVKEMDGTTRATIIEVDVHYEQERDNDTNRDYTKTTYSFTYEYCVNDTYFRGYGHSDFKKRKNQKIKIYYNKMRPEKSETAERHNYFLRIVIFIVVIITLLFIGLTITK